MKAKTGCSTDKDICGCRRCVAALELIAQKKADTHLTVQNQQAMALTHGFAHGIVQSVLFNIRYGFVATG